MRQSKRFTLKCFRFGLDIICLLFMIVRKFSLLSIARCLLNHLGVNPRLCHIYTSSARHNFLFFPWRVASTSTGCSIAKLLIEHLGVCPKKLKDALRVFNTFPITDFVAFPEKINGKLVMGISFWYWCNIILLQQQRYRIMLCSTACVMKDSIPIPYPASSTVASMLSKCWTTLAKSILTCDMRGDCKVVVEST